jgi:SAM-dependent methyltransferase
MMQDFGFPASAGAFRFRGEIEIATRLIGDVDPDVSVLDLGSGMGFWTEHFARTFARVVSVEASPCLHADLAERCSIHTNVVTVNDDALTFDPCERFGLIFLGGLLMYLNDTDLIALLRKLSGFLEPGGIILCRESTVRRGTLMRQGDYQVIYRSVRGYERLFADSGLYPASVDTNAPYILAQMACELVNKWKAHVPERLWCLPVIGRLLYWGLRLGHPRCTRLARRVCSSLGGQFPELTNHFFVLKRGDQCEAASVGAPTGENASDASRGERTRAEEAGRN